MSFVSEVLKQIGDSTESPTHLIPCRRIYAGRLPIICSHAGDEGWLRHSLSFVECLLLASITEPVLAYHCFVESLRKRLKSDETLIHEWIRTGYEGVHHLPKVKDLEWNDAAFAREQAQAAVYAAKYQLTPKEALKLADYKLLSYLKLVVRKKAGPTFPEPTVLVGKRKGTLLELLNEYDPKAYQEVFDYHDYLKPDLALLGRAVFRNYEVSSLNSAKDWLELIRIANRQGKDYKRRLNNVYNQLYSTQPHSFI